MCVGHVGLGQVLDEWGLPTEVAPLVRVDGVLLDAAADEAVDEQADLEDKLQHSQAEEHFVLDWLGLLRVGQVLFEVRRIA